MLPYNILGGFVASAASTGIEEGHNLGLFQNDLDTVRTQAAELANSVYDAAVAIVGERAGEIFAPVDGQDRLDAQVDTLARVVLCGTAAAILRSFGDGYEDEDESDAG